MAVDFWQQICEELNYRFFTGIPFAEVANLYKTMNSSIMHYIPAAHEDIAAKMATGTWISGFQSAVILEADKINKIDLDFNFKNNIPILFITNAKIELDLFMSKDLVKVCEYIAENKKPAVFIYG